MKKLLLAVAIVASVFTANAQEGEFNIGANVGLPTGNASNTSSFVIGAEVNYLFEVSDEFKVGPSLAYSHFIGKEQKASDALGGALGDLGGAVGGLLDGLADAAGVNTSTDISYLPIAAAARYSASESFTLGADLGYAVGISPSGAQGGFYYRPVVGYNLGESTMIQASYSGISVTGGSLSNFGLGVMFKL